MSYCFVTLFIHLSRVIVFHRCHITYLFLLTYQAVCGGDVLSLSPLCPHRTKDDLR